MANNTKIRVPRQTRSIQKKEQIKKTALLLFSENGYHNVSTNEIAKDANISIGTLYSYYKNKKEIYEELVSDLYVGILNGILPKTASSANSPKDLIKHYILYILQSHSYMTKFQKEITALSYQREEFRKLEEPYRLYALSKIHDLLDANRFQLRVTDLNTAAYIIHISTEAVVHELSFYQSDYDKEQVIDEFANMLYRYLFL